MVILVTIDDDGHFVAFDTRDREDILSYLTAIEKSSGYVSDNYGELPSLQEVLNLKFDEWIEVLEALEQRGYMELVSL